MRGDVEARRFTRTPLVAVVLLAIGAALLGGPSLRGQSQAGTLGQWTTLPYLMPINPVHLALLRNGKVLVVSGSGNVATETTFRAGLWDPTAGTITTQLLGWDMFCNGMVTLPDGRVFVNGGNLQYDPFHGQSRNAVYDPTTDLFSDVENMAHGRWYPTVTVLGDGSVMTFSGLSETGGTNTAVEIYRVGSGWSSEIASGWTPPLYPRMHLLPDGRVLYSGSGTGSRIFNPTTKSWTAVVATTNYSGTRTYGTSVLLPLTSANGYKPRVMIFGGGNPATATTEILDLSATPLQWQNGPPMTQPRIEMNATILPTGKVLATGGSKNDEDATTASYNADLYDANTSPITVTSAGANAFPRLYHSGSLLLPDATVALIGGNPTRGSYEQHIEIYSPAYLFNPDGSAASRPTIGSVTPGLLAFGSTFQVQTPDAADITSVVLIRPGTPTHAFDMDQRLVAMSYSAGPGVLDVTAPPNGNIAPPGNYMLFLVNSAGVPSIATFVQLTPPSANQSPSATILSPSGDVTVNPGQTVSFSGSGSDSDGTIASYSWSFPGGNPAASAQASPGSVTYSTPGTYVASFTVTDNGGATSQAATRTITVPDFSVSAAPASQAVAPGGSAAYTTTVTAGTGFTGLVTFSVTGLPTGATATFNPTSVNASGSTMMAVSTGASTPPGSYPLTIKATSGPVSHTASTTLVVNAVGDFSIAVTPASRTVQNGASTTYAVTISPTQGFSSSVSLSVGSLPKFVTASFSPTSLASGTATLTVATKKQTKSGTYTLGVTAAGGGQTHSSSITLVVQ